MAYTCWENLAQVERYAKSRYRHWDQRWVDRRERKLVRLLLKHNRIEGPILDIPVGYGRFQPLLREFGPLVAADINYYAALYQHTTVSFCDGAVNAAAEALPFKTDSFRAVFSFRLLQHMHDPEERRAIWSEFSRVSTDWVVVSSYIGSALHRLQRRLFPQPSRITMLDRVTFLSEAEQAGLKLVENKALLPGLHAQQIFLFAVE